MIEDRIDSGIEIVMISVLRQLPRNSRIMSRREGRGDDALAYTTPLHGGLHEDRLVARHRDRHALGELFADQRQLVP